MPVAGEGAEPSAGARLFAAPTAAQGGVSILSG